MTIFKDRVEAGHKLAQKLFHYKNKKNVLVLGLVRGGVIVAAQVAQELNLPLDIIVVRKIGAPQFPELAVGALTQGGNPWFNESLILQLGITKDALEPIINAERAELERRLKTYRVGKKPLTCTGKTVVLVDDGIATGATMHAAVQSAQEMGAKKIIIAVPVCPPEIVKEFEKKVDEVICLETPSYFPAVGSFYRYFEQVSDYEVVKNL